MTHTLPPALLRELSAYLADNMGLYFGPDRLEDLQRGVASAGPELGFADAESCVQQLLSAPPTRQQIDILASHLTVGETYFFRDKRSFEILEQRILPEFIHSRRGGLQRLRVWSAGCATGEEAYSLAILLTQLIPDWRAWQITVLATDINTASLAQAERGEYGEWSFRDAPPWLKDRCFQRTANGRYAIVPHIKQLVSFGYLNLVRDVYPSLFNNTNAMDVILCRNVVMYFSEAQARRVMVQLQHCLVDGGWLLSHPAESWSLAETGLTAVSFPEAVLHRRAETGSSLGPPHAAALPAAVTRSPPRSASRPASGHPRHADRRDHPDPHQKALAQYRAGQYAEAAQSLKRLVADGAEERETLELLARVYADQGALAEALAWCERAITADKLNPGGYYLRATMLQEQGNLEEAARSLDRALYLDQDFVLAHFARGNLCRAQGKTRLAAKHLANALRLLETQPADALVPESDGVTAGRLREIIAAVTTQGAKP